MHYSYPKGLHLLLPRQPSHAIVHNFGRGESCEQLFTAVVAAKPAK